MRIQGSVIWRHSAVVGGLALALGLAFSQAVGAQVSGPSGSRAALLAGYCDSTWQAGHREIARGFCRRAAMVEGLKIEQRVRIGEILLQLAEPDAALAVWRGLSIAKPDDPAFAYGHGRALVLKGDYRAALFYFRAALDRRPDDPRNHAAVGVMYEVLGDRDGARAAYRGGLAVATADLRLRQNLARLDEGGGFVITSPPTEIFAVLAETAPVAPPAPQGAGLAALAAEVEAIAAENRRPQVTAAPRSGWRTIGGPRTLVRLQPTPSGTVSPGIVAPTMQPIQIEPAGENQVVQLGRYANPSDAWRGLGRVRRSADDILAGVSLHIRRQAAAGGKFVLTTSDFAEPGAARALCDKLRGRGLTCDVVVAEGAG